MPVVGMLPVTTAILSSNCMPTLLISPITSRDENVSGAFMAMTNPRHISTMKSTITATAPTSPSSSQTIEKMKSFCGSGSQRCF